MKVLFVVLALVAGIFSVSAQLHFVQIYDTGTIPQNVREGADAVVRYSETEVEYVSPLMSNERNVSVVTVLKPGGQQMAYLLAYTDMFSSLSGFSGEIYDAQGALVRKIKRSDLRMTDYSGSDLKNDNRIYYCMPSLPKPPYTVKYEWSITTRNAVWVFPSLAPQPGRSVGVEKAVYRLKGPADLRFYTRAYNLEPEYSVTQSTERTLHSGVMREVTTHRWSVENIAPLASVPYSKPGWEILPVVFFSPETFIYDNVPGGMKDWQNYAEWQWKLLERSGAVPGELSAFVARLTEGAKSDMEKIRILYDYMAVNMRYVSIQVGIGGFQPMPVAQVHSMKYGDCKALTNYLRLMLAECGIDSHYVEIGIGRRSIPRDFVSPAMSNHAILMVPVGADTLWVECTNPKLPLGYRHDAIVGQNALVYKDGTAEIITVPRYADSLNLSERHARVTIEAGGEAIAHVVTTNHVHRFEDYWAFGKMETTDQINKLRTEINLHNTLISNPSYREDKSAEPTAIVEYDITTPQLGSRTGDRLFLNAMSFRKPHSARFPRGERTEDICVRQGYSDVDITHFAMPDGAFAIEALPAPVALRGKYGVYSMTCRPEQGGIAVERRLLLYTGSYDKEEYADFRSFIEAVSGADNAKIVLKNVR